MKTVFALIGRPNVGKSTIFNQITKTRQALVADLPGLTRDRQYGHATYDDKSFIIIDTGGIGESEKGIDDYMESQSRTAIEEADVILFVLDARAGLLASDQQIAKQLRQLGKKIFVIANKTDGVHEASISELFALGLGEPIHVAASHGRGIAQLLEVVTEHLPPDDEDLQDDVKGLKLSIIGRPNVGKSTLVNRLLGEDRVVVYDMPGTTRDSIYIPFNRDGKDYTIIDTAGVRRKGRIGEKVEKFSVIKTLQAIKDSNVVVLVVDAKEGIVEQDLHLLGFALEAGRAVVIAINKWDGMTDYQKRIVQDDIERRFAFASFVKVHLISAKYGNGVGNLYPSIHKAFQASMTKVSTSRLTQVLQDAVDSHAPPMVGGRRIKLRYAHMGGHNPPVFVIHGNQVTKIPKDYQRYLENVFRKVFNLQGTPITMEFKQGENPYAGRKNKVSDRVVNKKKREVQKFKKMENKRRKK